jgi:prepilin signal peptidase PulO-like enzyme (type II secretory pathway)
MERQDTLQQNRRFCTFCAVISVLLALLGLAGMFLQWKMPSLLLLFALLILLLIPLHRLQFLAKEYKLRVLPFYLIYVAILWLILYLRPANRDPQDPIHHFLCYLLLAFYSLFIAIYALPLLHKLAKEKEA